MANLLEKLTSGLTKTRSISSAIDTLLGAGDAVAARAAIGAQARLSDLSTLTEHSVSLQSIAGNSRFTIFSLSGAHEIVNGSVFGPVVGVRITVDGGTPVDLDAVAAMYPSGTTNLISIAPVPPVRCTTSLQVEIMNLSAGAQSCGAKIYTRAAT